MNLLKWSLLQLRNTKKVSLFLVINFTLGFLGFTISRALHGEADSSRRATVLSVKGLAFNLGYGLFSFSFSRLLTNFPDQPVGAALRSALLWQVPAFALVIMALFAWASFSRKAKIG